jgi:predicted nucleic acid-binding protein
VIYLDTCSAIKLAYSEPETVELNTWLAERHGTRLISSVLMEVELERALRRNAPRALPMVSAILRRIILLEITPEIRRMAASYADPLLRSLDAIHLATAQTVASFPGEGLSDFVSYDKRLISAAREAGVHVEHPGARY